MFLQVFDVFVLVAKAMITGAMVAVASVSAQSADCIRIFHDGYYGGASTDLCANTPDLADIGFDNQVSSVIVGSNVAGVTYFDAANYDSNGDYYYQVGGRHRRVYAFSSQAGAGRWWRSVTQVLTSHKKQRTPHISVCLLNARVLKCGANHRDPFPVE